MNYIRVSVNIGYTVPDNSQAIDHATEALWEDIENLARDRGEFFMALDVAGMPQATADDVPAFIREAIEMTEHSADDFEHVTL